MSTSSVSHQSLQRRAARTRAKLAYNTTLPRLSVHRTLRHIYAQIIDDVHGKTLAHASDAQIKDGGTKTEVAQKVGAQIAEIAKQNKIKAVRFDRGARKYHGRIAALAEAARKNGLEF